MALPAVYCAVKSTSPRITATLLAFGCFASLALAQTGTLQQGDLQLQSGEYADAIEREFTAGSTWSIALTSSEFDPYLLILDPTGETILEVDDSPGHGLDVAAELTVASSGLHILVVTSARPDETGDYDLIIAPGTRPEVAAPPSVDAAAFTGRFAGSGLTLELRSEPTGLVGTLAVGGQSYPVEAQAQGNSLVGTFLSGSTAYAFTATLDGDSMRLESDGASYDLVREMTLGGNPLALPPGGTAAPPADQSATGAPALTTTLAGGLPPAPAIPDPGPGRAAGFVRTGEGEPLAGVEVRIEGVNMEGGRISAYPVTDAQGRYLTRVPDGLVRVNAYLTRDYNGQRYFIRLAPDQGSFDQEFDTSLAGVVRNFSLRFDGLRPGGDPNEPSAYFGGYGTIEIGQPSCCVEQHVVEPGSGVRIELTPDGPLLDGSPGSTLVLGCDSCVPEPLSYAPQWNLEVMEFREVPAGRYRARAWLIAPDGSARAARIGSHNFRDGASSGAVIQELAESLIVQFPPYNLVNGEPGIGELTFYVSP